MDHHSTTPVDPSVLEAMLPYFSERFGNAASLNHLFGLDAEKAVAQSRQKVADLICCDPKEIIFTSGATESNNIALKGINQKNGNHIITGVTEHKSIIDITKRLQKNGSNITYLPVDLHGKIDLSTLAEAITDKTILISVMMANHEIGTIQPISEIGKIAKQNKILFHVDATQAAGKIPIDVNAMGIDLLSFSAHKLYGPKGVGALYLRNKNPRIDLAPLFDGGGHERGFRSGTLNVPGIVGFGVACAISQEKMTSESKRLKEMRDRLQSQLFSGLDEVYQNGHPTDRLPHNLNMSFAYVEGESLLMKMSHVALSLGSACMTGALAPSYVLTALGVPPNLAYSSVRFGLGRFNTDREVDEVGRLVIAYVKELRAISPLYRKMREKNE